MRWQNWSGLESAEPREVAAPASPDAVVAAVRAARESGSTVKMVGTGHSFTGIASPGDVMLRPDRLSGVVSVDREAMTVTAYAGTQLKVLNAELERLGLSLHNMGDIAEQTLAGAVSTGTHGTGGHAAGLAAQLAGFELVTGTGEVLSASRADGSELFELGRVGLGALGILTTVSFTVEPLFLLRAHEEPMSWDAALGSFDQMVGESDHCDMYWFPHTDRMLTKRNTRLAAEVSDAEPVSRLRGWVDDELLSNTVFGALTAAANRVPGVIPRMNQVSARALSARSYSDVAHRVFTSPRRVVFREMEYAVPRAAGLDALREARRLVEASDWRISFPVEIRVAPADDVALSTAYQRDALYLAFHTHHRSDWRTHAAYLAAMESVMRDHDGRPHWGKLHTRTAADLAPSYPRFVEFVALRERLDPDRLFANDYLRRVLGD
ncbi:MAG TPA: D-arabinono-1,4-lactone oxidase [Nocardioides sp.]|uniref:D-arabinono-1,4-lactone oxidase n=1 Tax=Nocardioides sp. TaxID=35761 RepID=UPI002E3206A2|nr:D-arabinono-1,4-lactone oxidase [Nocardioides sp.]HEX3930549.1 D-arabinono-1,4-lactone oxidase [Nocardioides sp.]